MPFLAFELDAIEAVPDVARLAGVPDGSVALGLLRLWRWCWREKTDIATTDQLGGFFGGDGVSVGRALVAFGFAADEGGGRFRVRGAERYLRIRKAQSAAGKANAKNLRRGPGAGEGSPAQPEGKPEVDPENLPGPFSEQRAASSEQSKKPSRERAPVNPRRGPLLEELRGDFLELVGSEMAGGGAAENVALNRLLGLAEDREIRARWRKALALGARWPGCSSLAQLASDDKWNALAMASAPAEPSRGARPDPNQGILRGES